MIEKSKGFLASKIVLLVFFLFVLNIRWNQKASTYYIGRVSVRNVKHVHGSYHTLHGHKYILVDEFDKTALVLVWVAGTVNNAHLFDESRFTRLSRTYLQER